MAFKIADGYVEVTARVNKNQFRSAAASAGHDAGDDAGNRFSRAMLRQQRSFLSQWRANFQKMVPTNLLTFGPVMASMAAAAIGVTNALVGLVASLGHGLTTITALIPAAAALGAAFFVLKTAWDNIDSGPLVEFKERLEGLSDTATKYAQPAFDRFFSAVNKNFGIFDRFIRDTAKSLASFSDVIADAFSARNLGDRLTAMLASASTGMGSLSAASGHLLESLITLGAGAGPVFERFAAWLANVTQRWNAWLIEAYKTGALKDFFVSAANEMSKWGQILWNFLSGLVGVFTGAHTEGVKMASALLRISESFKTWAWDENTHGKIRELMERIADFDFSKLFQIAAGIMAMGLAFKTMMGVTNMVTGLLGLLALGPAAAILTGVALALGALATAFVIAYQRNEDFRKSVNDAVAAIRDKFGPIIQSVRTWIEEDLRPAIEWLANFLRGHFSKSFEAVGDAVRNNRDELEVLATIMNGLVTAAMWVVIAMLGLVGKEIASTIAFIGKLIDWWGSLVRGVQTAANAIGRAVLAIVSFVQGLVNSWANAFTAILNIAIAVASRIAPGMVPGLNAAKNKVEGLRDDANRALNGIKKSVKTNIIANTSNFDRRVANVKRQLASLPSSRTIRITTIQSLVKQEIAQGNRRYRTGGITSGTGGMVRGAVGGGPRGNLSLVGETGPELVRLPQGSHVTPAGGTRQKLDRMAGGSGMTVNLYVQGSIRSDKDLVEVIRNEFLNGGFRGVVTP